MNVLKVSIVAVLLCVFVMADTLNGYVVGVSDGDTIKVIDSGRKQHRVRLWGIDAPESRQAFGQKSKQYLSQMVFNKNVRIEYREKDKYGRILGTVYVDGENVNLKMVQAGLAWHYVYFAPEEKALADAEKMARKNNLGLWSDKGAVPPWDFRRSGRKRKGGRK